MSSSLSPAEALSGTLELRDMLELAEETLELRDRLELELRDRLELLRDKTLELLRENLELAEASQEEPYSVLEELWREGGVCSG